MEATIVATKVFPPKPGKKRYTIVSSDEKLWGAMPDVASKFKEGGTYNIFYKEDHFGGKTYHVIEGATEAAGSAPKPSVATPAAANTGKYGAKDDETAERIFVCGALNATMGNPNFTPTELTGESLTNLVRRLRGVWADTFGSPAVKPEKSKNDDMNDDIPF